MVASGRSARPTYADSVTFFNPGAVSMGRPRASPRRSANTWPTTTCASPTHQLGADSSLWVAWPRRAGGHQSDLTDQVLREVLLPVGVVDVKVAALDGDWSGLKFVWRRANRESRTPG